MVLSRTVSSNRRLSGRERLLSQQRALPPIASSVVVWPLRWKCRSGRLRAWPKAPSVAGTVLTSCGLRAPVTGITE